MPHRIMLRLALALVVMASVSACTSTASGPSATTVSVPTTVSAPTTVLVTPPDTPVLDTPVGEAAAVTTWYAGVESDLGAVEDAMGAVSTAGNNQDIVAMSGACQQLGAAVLAFQADPPAPNVELAGDLDTAMTNYSAAASDCIAGDYTSASTEMTTGNDAITAATAVLGRLS